METSKTAQLPDPRSIGRRPFAMLGIAAVALIAVCSSFAWRGTTVAAQAGGDLQGLGIVTGTVTAHKPFTAGHVYLRSQDPQRDMLYMVYTQRGAFKAVAVMPGNYELVAKARGLESDPQRIVVKSGANPAVKVTMRDAKDPDQYPTSVDPSEARSANGVLSPEPEIMYASYEEIYPPGPGLAVLEGLCMRCHGENYFPLQPKSASAWQFGLDRMMGTALTDNDKRGLGEGILAGSASHFRFGIQDRKDVLEYLTKHFGPDKKPRAVRTDSEMPLDEAQLGKAQYIEYYIKADENDSADPPPAGAVASDSEQTATGVAGVRIMMMPTIDQQGNRWSVDRGVPSRLVKLDPRSGEYRAWTLPDPRAGVHDLVMDRQGQVWVLEFSRTEDGRVEGGGSGSSELDSRLLMFDPKTEKWEKIIDPDPDDLIRAKRKGPLMGGVVDSKGNIYVHWMLTGALSKYDVATGKASTYRIPTPNAVPYGAFIDPFDNVWLAEWGRGKLARFDTTTEAWTEFTPPNFPVNFRRGGQSDAEGNVWVGIWAAGKTARNGRQAGSEDGSLDVLGHPAPRGATLRSVGRQRRQHLVPGQERAPSRPADGKRPAQPARWDVHVLPEAAVHGRLDACSPHRGRLRALHGALWLGEGLERLRSPVSRQGQDHDAGSAHAERAARLLPSRFRRPRGRVGNAFGTARPVPRARCASIYRKIKLSS